MINSACEIIRLHPVTTPAVATTVAARPAVETSVHPHVLLVHWEIYSRAHNWEAAYAVAEELVVRLDDEPIGWIYRSFALKQMKRTEEAREKLIPAARKFSNDWRIAYNLACYHAQLGDIAGAWNWIDRAIEIGDVEQIKLEALAEPALEALWARL